MIDIKFDTKEVDAMLSELLNRVKRPKRLMKKIERYVLGVTKKMFGLPRPDTKGVRGVKWAKLAPSTVKGKNALKKAGKAIESHRPLVRTGAMRDSIDILMRSEKGFVFGTVMKSSEGAPYPGIHNVGGKENRPPQRMWLFLTEKDYAQMAKMTTDYLNGK